MLLLVIFFYIFHLVLLISELTLPYADLFQLAEDGELDWDALSISLKPHTKCAFIQRSCGYSWRRSLSVDEIGRAIGIIKVYL